MKKMHLFVNDVAKQHYQTNEVIGLLQELASDTNADRCWVLSCWHWAEGDVKVRGLKETGTWNCDFELVSDALESQLHRYQNLPCAVLWLEWKRGELDGYTCIGDIDDKKTYSSENLDENIHRSRGADSYYGAKVSHPYSNQMIGVLGCDWKKSVGFTQAEAAIIEHAAEKLGGHIR